MTRIEKVLYTAKAHTTGGRDGGASRTSDGRLDVKLSVPGTSGTGTNPEQLFAVGWSACFLSAIKIVAARMKVRLPADLAIDTEVDLGTTGGGSCFKLASTSACRVLSAKSPRPWRTARTRSVHIPKPHMATSTSLLT